MREHGQKLVLVAIHLAQSLPGLANTFFTFLLNLLDPFALRHVVENHGKVTIIRGRRLNMHPARSANLATERHVADLFGLALDNLLEESVENGATFKGNEDTEARPNQAGTLHSQQSRRRRICLLDRPIAIERQVAHWREIVEVGVAFQPCL